MPIRCEHNRYFLCQFVSCSGTILTLFPLYRICLLSYINTYIINTTLFSFQVRCNPLQRFPSSPIIQYRENYRNVPRIQPSNLESYPHLYMTQSPLTTYHNIPVSLNNYVQGIHLNNILQNEINSAINSNNCEQNGIQSRRYALNSTDLFIPNVVNNYYIVSPDNFQKNFTKNCRKRNANENSTLNNNSEPKRKKKCKKRKISEITSESGDNNKRKCSRKKEMNKENNGQTISQPNKQDVKSDRNNQCKVKSIDRSQSLTDQKEKKIDHSTANTKQTSAQQRNCKATNNNYRNIDQNNSQYTEAIPPKSGKEVKTKKNKSNNCQKLIEKDDTYDWSKIFECFNVNNECNNRCTRNYKEDNVQKYQQQYQIPSDFSNMAPYMMFNQQSFNTDRYFPYNFDYLYNMQQFQNINTNTQQKKPKNRRVNRRKKQKKGKGKNCDQNKTIKEPDNCDKVVELSPELIKGQMTCGPVSTQVEEPQIERSIHDVSDTNNKNVKESLKLSDEEEFPPVDDYYPEFHSDNIYTSKEEYDWDIFHDRNYYSSSDMSDLDRERRKYDSTDDINTFKYNKITILDDNLKPSSDVKIENIKNKEGEKITMNVNDKDERDNDKPNKSSEEIQFRTPPPLDFPDFKTEMINKDNHETKTETIYQANTKTDNEYKNNKMSNYSNVKKADNEKRNTIVDQNDVETVSGHSKVVKYGTPPNKEEQKADIEKIYNFKEENKNSNDGKTTIVIAKSLPYPIV